MPQSSSSLPSSSFKSNNDVRPIGVNKRLYLDWKWRRKYSSSSKRYSSIQQFQFHHQSQSMYTRTYTTRTNPLTITILLILVNIIFILHNQEINIFTINLDKYNNNNHHHKYITCSAFSMNNYLEIRHHPIPIMNNKKKNEKVLQGLVGGLGLPSPIVISNTRIIKQSCLYMGKGDGKKKRKKKSPLATSTSTPSSSSSSSSSSTQQQQQQQPLRVTSNSLIPVRRQIRWAQMKKEAARNSGTSFRQTNIKRTRFRKSLNETEVEQARVERHRRGQDVNWDVILNATASTPLVIVDGYNIIHKYPKYKKWMKKSMLSKARNMLTHDMEELRALKGWRIEVVFDGYGRDLNGPLGEGSGSANTRDKVTKSDQESSKKETDYGVRVVYSGAGMSADNYIEARCFEARKVTDGKLTGSLIIATDDNLIRSAGVSAGGVCMSADRLIDDIRALKKATMYRVEAAVAKANGHDVRPPQLMGKVMPTAFNRGASLIIEDKRNRKKKKNENSGDLDGEQQQAKRTLEDLKKGTTSLPSWAVIPTKDPS